MDRSLKLALKKRIYVVPAYECGLILSVIELKNYSKVHKKEEQNSIVFILSRHHCDYGKLEKNFNLLRMRYICAVK